MKQKGSFSPSQMPRAGFPLILFKMNQPLVTSKTLRSSPQELRCNLESSVPMRVCRLEILHHPVIRQCKSFRHLCRNPIHVRNALSRGWQMLSISFHFLLHIAAGASKKKHYLWIAAMCRHEHKFSRRYSRVVQHRSGIFCTIAVRVNVISESIYFSSGESHRRSDANGSSGTWYHAWMHQSSAVWIHSRVSSDERNRQREKPKVVRRKGFGNSL